mmetsp:Transcript_4748/g.13283  ORF Transcript_4748/g.13283 Transcript_4748/m.13283 type:complete len:161 (+) Transcript_4748:243-725(+)
MSARPKRPPFITYETPIMLTFTSKQLRKNEPTSRNMTPTIKTAQWSTTINANQMLSRASRQQQQHESCAPNWKPVWPRFTQLISEGYSSLDSKHPIQIRSTRGKNNETHLPSESSLGIFESSSGQGSSPLWDPATLETKKALTFWHFSILSSAQARFGRC